MTIALVIVSGLLVLAITFIWLDNLLIKDLEESLSWKDRELKKVLDSAQKLDHIIDQWRDLYHKNHIEWKDFYLSQIEIWEAKTVELIEKAAQDARLAEWNKWMGNTKKPSPQN